MNTNQDLLKQLKATRIIIKNRYHYWLRRGDKEKAKIEELDWIECDKRIIKLKLKVNKR